MKKDNPKKPQKESRVSKEMKGLQLKLGKIAKKYDFDFDLVKQIYNDMTEGGENIDLITMELLEKQIAWAKNEGAVTFEDYRAKIAAVIEDVKARNQIKPPTNEEEMNELRKKLGYNNKEWRQVRIIERQMGDQLKKLILEFMAGALAADDKSIMEKPTESDLFKALDTRWRNYARNYVIREYPRANTHKAMRTRITELFEKKLIVALTPENVPQTQEMKEEE